MKKYNLNQPIKVKLTPLGVDIYYHSFDQVRDAVPTINGMPKIDKDGFSEFSLWDFMHIYGEHIGLGKKEVLRDCCIYLEDDEHSRVYVSPDGFPFEYGTRYC